MVPLRNSDILQQLPTYQPVLLHTGHRASCVCVDKHAHKRERKEGLGKGKQKNGEESARPETKNSPKNNNLWWCAWQPHYCTGWQKQEAKWPTIDAYVHRCG